MRCLREVRVRVRSRVGVWAEMEVVLYVRGSGLFSHALRIAFMNGYALQDRSFCFR